MSVITKDEKTVLSRMHFLITNFIPMYHSIRHVEYKSLSFDEQFMSVVN